MTLLVWTLLTLAAASAAYGLARFLKARRAKRRRDAMMASIQALADDMKACGIRLQSTKDVAHGLKRMGKRYLRG